MFRTSARQLSRCARLPLRTAVANPAYRAAAFARIAPASGISASRLYSTKPPGPPKPPNSHDGGKSVAKEEPKANSSSSPSPNTPETPAEKRPLPEGWVWLTDEEYTHLEALSKVMTFVKNEQFKMVFKMTKEYGAPTELRDLIHKHAAGGLTMFDSMKVLRVLSKLAQREASLMAEGKWDPKAFSSNKPGQEPEQQTGQQQQQQQAPEKEQEQEQEQEQEKGKEREQENQAPNESNKSDKKQGSKPNPTVFTTSMSEILMYTGATILFYPFYLMLFGTDSSREITWQELRTNFLERGLVQKLVVNGGKVRVELNQEATQAMYPDSIAGKPGFNYYFTIGSIDSFERHLDEVQQELGIPTSERIQVQYAHSGMMANVFLAFGPTLLFVGLLIYMSRGRSGGGSGGVFGIGKSKAKMFNHDSAVKVKFADVAGMDEAKLEIMEFVSFLKTPERFERLGAKIPRGAILSGPPGTGKTLLAKATAGESQVPFFSVSGSEFVEMFVGVGASRVRDLFATARKNAPCIVFIDEIDAIGRHRSDGGPRSGGNDEREATLNQILTEMDGFNTAEQVVVLAGTNRPDVLDKALMRPGRFDRHIHIDRPTMSGRQAIFKVHLKNIVTKEDIEHLTGRLAALTPGFAGADIANAVNEAALVAARANAKSVEMVHFEQAIERVVGGLERKSLVLGPEEKRTVAYHEAGHAVCGWYFRWADPLLKVSIIPRGQGALGYAQYLPSSDAYLMNTNQLKDRMAMTLGGRVSEELHFPSVTSGASDDFKKVTQMATTMVTKWGMSEKLGPLHFNDSADQFNKPFAESTAQTIDSEVRRIIDEAYQQCKELLTARKKEVGIVAEELLRKEMLDRDDMHRLLGPREWPDKEEFAKYFGAGQKSAPPPFPTENTDSPPDAQPAFKGAEADEGIATEDAKR